jgi:hypothetical protein
MPGGNPFRSTLVEPNNFRISSYGSLSQRDARRKIKRLLDQTNFMISAEYITQGGAGRQTGGNFPTAVPAKAIVHGVTNVLASNDGSGNNYGVEYGRPVCFDMVTGAAVTGIHPSWTGDEYKIVGTALADMPYGLSRIPVLLGVQPSDSFAVVGVAFPNEAVGNTWPTMLDWSAAEDIADQQAVWDFELPFAVEFDEQGFDGDGIWEPSGVFAKVCNLSRQYVYKDMFVLLHSSGKPKLQLYCEFYMSPTISGVLNDHVEQDGKGNITIDNWLRGGIEGDEAFVWDNRMLPSGKRLTAGTRVIANLFRFGHSGDDGRFVWQYYITQADKCPVSTSSSS